MKEYNRVFWGEIAPSDHLLQIYESDDLFLHALESYAACGLLNGDGVIIIATDSHIAAIEAELSKNVELESYRASGQYISKNAEEALHSFMKDDKIDEKLFNEFVSSMLEKAKKNNGKVRAFGEMVAVLWGQGNRAAVSKLEKLWGRFCKKEMLCLFCAYPANGFRQDVNASIEHICSLHTKLLKENTHPTEAVNIYGERYSFFPAKNQ
jgi:hypothetical protein